ncbi:MAG: zinc ribbon domain-containing protein [Promethearchaeota archaeon]
MRIKSIRKITTGLILFTLCAGIFYSQMIMPSEAADTQEFHDYELNQNNLVISGLDWYYAYGDLLLGDEITGLIQTSDSDEDINFYIMDEDEYADYAGGFTFYGYHFRYNYHVLYVDFTIPYSDTWYFVIENDGLFSVTLDMYLDTNGDHSPYYSSTQWDQVENYETLEPAYLNYYLIGDGDLGKGDVITCSYATMFSSDGVDVYVLNEMNKDRYLAHTTYEYVYHRDGYYESSFEVEIPEKGSYFIIFTSRDEADTITYGFGLNVKKAFPLVAVLVGGGVGVVALAVTIPLSVSASKKKKARLAGQVPGVQPTSAPPAQPSVGGGQQPAGTQTPPDQGLSKSFCDKCGMKLQPGAVFCPACGKSLK